MTAALIYGGLHLLWYWQTPLGQIPVLDERENLDLARLIATGLPAEPFYRAPGYPGLLSIGYWLGVPAAGMPFAATFIGLLIHGASAYVAALCARRLFSQENHHAAWVAGLLYGLNPVLIHQATQILDGALANFGLLLGALSLIGALDEDRPSFRPALGTAMAWSLTALVRPQLIVAWLAFPVIWWLATRRPGQGVRSVSMGVAALVISMLPLLAFGAVQARLSDTFRIMPTQGPYNLWAANKPGAHGRYFSQTIRLPATEAHRNPTLVESQVLYTRETSLPADDIDVVNAHWSRRLRDTALADPAGLLQRALARVYHLFNDAEQYNNKTYAFHKARSPWLRFNPIGWGVVLLGGVAGLVVLGTGKSRRRALTALALGGALTVGIAIAFVSDRFRLPLVAGLSVMAGGLAGLPQAWPAWSMRTRAGLILLLICTAAFTYSRFLNTRSDATFIQDHLLLAAAAVQTGDDALAWTEAGAALARSPGHPDALAWRVTSYFNQLLTRTANPDLEPAWADASRHLLAQQQSTPAVEVLAAIALWRAGEHAEAETLWRSLARQSEDARLALVFAGLAPASDALLTPSAAGPLTRLVAIRERAEKPDEIHALISALFTTRP